MKPANLESFAAGMIIVLVTLQHLFGSCGIIASPSSNEHELLCRFLEI